jgi:F420-0:gamma-glutamyl ligase-like protein
MCLRSQIKYKAIKSPYWRPGDDYINSIIECIRNILHNNDIIVLSEKAVSTAKGNIVNEYQIKPSFIAYILSKFWIPISWGYFLGYLCRFKKVTINRLRNYPLIPGSRHKQLVLEYASVLSALKYGSEDGIDLSNLPYSYACLPLTNPQEEAQYIYTEISRETGKKVTIIITDTDSTFSFRNFHFTSRPHAIDCIKYFNGPLAFVLGRMFKLRQRATPLAIAGNKINIEEALDFSEVAHRVRGSGIGRTIWDGAERLNVGVTEITWNMLEQITHYPIVIIRKR